MVVFFFIDKSLKNVDIKKAAVLHKDSDFPKMRKRGKWGEKNYASLRSASARKMVVYAAKTRLVHAY